MKTKQQKLLRSLIIISVIIALAALAVGIMAACMKEYIIALAMLIVIGWQALNIIKWKKYV